MICIPSPIFQQFLPAFGAPLLYSYDVSYLHCFILSDTNLKKIPLKIPFRAFTAIKVLTSLTSYIYPVSFYE